MNFPFPKASVSLNSLTKFISKDQHGEITINSLPLINYIMNTIYVCRVALFNLILHPPPPPPFLNYLSIRVEKMLKYLFDKIIKFLQMFITQKFTHIHVSFL